MLDGVVGEVEVCDCENVTANKDVASRSAGNLKVIRIPSQANGFEVASLHGCLQHWKMCRSGGSMGGIVRSAVHLKV
jgi:hypothetical protein